MVWVHFQLDRTTLDGEEIRKAQENSIGGKEADLPNVVDSLSLGSQLWARRKAVELHLIYASPH